MAAGKWIGGFLGFLIGGGPLGALAGYALGWLFEEGLNQKGVDDGFARHDQAYGNTGGSGFYGNTNEQTYQEGQRNAFLFSMLALASYIIKADGRVMHSEMEAVRRFLRANFGEVAVRQGEQILLRLFEQQKQMGAEQFKSVIRQACAQIRQNFTYEQLLQLYNFLVIVAQADGSVPQAEVDALHFVAQWLGISQQDADSMLHPHDSANTLEAAYKTLGIEPTATDDEVKAAFRAMALKHHPDRVATLGDDVKAAAERKFKEINEAKERIYKARGL